MKGKFNQHRMHKSFQSSLIVYFSRIIDTLIIHLKLNILYQLYNITYNWHPHRLKIDLNEIRVKNRQFQDMKRAY